MRDWQAHHVLIHQHDNAKFMRPTKRMLDEPPVIERHDPTTELADLIIIIASIAALACGVILMVAGK